MSPRRQRNITLGGRYRQVSLYLTVFMFYCLNHHQICFSWLMTWWRHQMETFSALLAICAGNSAVAGEFPAQRPVTRSFDVFFDLRLNKRLSKQWWGWWFETLSCPLWRHCNGTWTAQLESVHWLWKNVCKGTCQKRKQHLRREKKGKWKKYWYPMRYYDIYAQSDIIILNMVFWTISECLDN